MIKKFNYSNVFHSLSQAKKVVGKMVEERKGDIFEIHLFCEKCVASLIKTGTRIEINRITKEWERQHNHEPKKNLFDKFMHAIR